MYAVMHKNLETDNEYLVGADIYRNEYHAEGFAEFLATEGSEHPPEVRNFVTRGGEIGTGFYVFQLDGRPTGVYYVCELNVVGPKET